MNRKILDAIEEVRAKVNSEVDTVVFFNDNSWMYMIGWSKEAPSFDGCNVDIFILEAALDSVETLPCVFQLNTIKI